MILLLVFALLLLAVGLFITLVVVLILRSVVAALPSLTTALQSLPFIMKYRASHPRTTAFLVARFSPAERLGLHLTLGFLASLLFAWAFAEIAEETKETGLVLLDRTVLHLASRVRTAGATDFFALVTLLADRRLIAPVSVLVALVLLIFRKPMLIAAYSATLIGGALLNVALKGVYMRSRPPGEQALVEATGWSFPSGHAMTSIVFYGMLVYTLFNLTGLVAARAAGAALAFMLVLMIGLSRIYLGVHYPTDVVAGYAAGLFWLVISATAMETYKRGRHGG